MTPSFIGSVKEGAVVSVVQMRKHDRTADTATEGSSLHAGLGEGGGIRVRNRVEGGALIIEEAGAVQRVGAAFGGDHHLTGVAVLRTSHCAVGANFRDGLRRGEGIA